MSCPNTPEIELTNINKENLEKIINNAKNNKKIFLTYKEGLLLKELINSKGVSIDRYSLNKKLQIGDRGIDITISRLRKKIEDNPKTPEYILTERGRGYIINNEIRVN